MAILVTKFRYYKPGSSKARGGYLKYIATRDHVQKIDDSRANFDATDGQKELIKQLLKDFPDSKEMLEYEDYLVTPTIKNASEFITRCLEDNAMGIGDNKTYIDYIATRPRVEKIGKHGLFTDSNSEIVLNAISKEITGYEGNIYTMIVSLRREDAVRLGYDNAYRWRDMLRGQTQKLAESLKIPYSNLKWYAAFHDEGHHPHIHLVAYSKKAQEGYLSRQGIMSMRSSLAGVIFAEDLHNIYTEQTATRDKIKKDWHQLVTDIIGAIDFNNTEHTEIEQKLILLAERLRRTQGKKVYGYLKRDVKDIIDEIVTMLEKDENISKLYDLWWEYKCEVLGKYNKEIPQTKPPLSENKEFKSLKNDIIREALKIGQQLRLEEEKNGESKSSGGKEKSGSSKSGSYKNKQYSPQVKKVSATAVTGLFKSLAMTFRDRILPPENSKIIIDKKQRQEEEAKRNAEITHNY